MLPRLGRFLATSALIAGLVFLAGLVLAPRVRPVELGLAAVACGVLWNLKWVIAQWMTQRESRRSAPRAWGGKKLTWPADKK